MDGKRIVTWFAALAALAALATPWVAQAQGTADPCDKNHYILRLKCGANDFPDIVTTGIATKTSIGAPLAVAVDAGGNVFFGNDQNAVYRVDPSGMLTLVAQPGGPPPPYDGWWIDWNPNALAAVDGAGNVYFVDDVENRVQRIAIDGTIVTVAGHSGGRDDSGHYEDGEWVVSPQPANDAVVVGARATDVYFVPTAVAIDDAGNLYVTSERADLYGLVKVAPDGVVESFMPFGCGDSAPGAVCQASGHIAVDDAGNAFVPDFQCRIHAFSASGGTDIVVGSGYNGYIDPSGAPTCLYLGDGGPAKAAGIGLASAVALGPDGSLYIADTQFNCIHKVGADGIIRMLAGSCPGPWQFHGVLLAGPMGVAVDAAGNVYIADSGNARVLKLTPDGVMTTIAGLLPAVPQ